jgi:hypothetical protein
MKIQVQITLTNCTSGTAETKLAYACVLACAFATVDALRTACRRS